jgi:16S rRNA (guanine1207-N2)-methyltransferase
MSLATLFHPFERGLTDLPRAGERWLFAGAEPGFGLPAAFGAELLCVQGFRPHFLDLRASGHSVESEFPAISMRFDGALVLLSRSRDANLLRLRDAAARVKPGGVVLVACAKEDGAASLRKTLEKALPHLDSASKHHGVAMWFRRPDDRALEYLLPWPQAGSTGDHATAPGMFSADAPDEGSRLLAGFFDSRISGLVADLGAGWGYLGMELLKACPRIVRLDCVEADHAALEAARGNLGPLAGDRPLSFHWLDVLREEIPGRQDWVIMNPPFHLGRRADPAIGAGFIAAAAWALKPGGRLLMVANRQLPYEDVLAKRFRKFERRAQTGRFKVFEAQS